MDGWMEGFIHSFVRSFILIQLFQIVVYLFTFCLVFSKFPKFYVRSVLFVSYIARSGRIVTANALGGRTSSELPSFDYGTKTVPTDR